MITELAMVSATQMTGQPYPTWFGRQQKIP